MKIFFPFETRIADFLFNPLSLRLLIVHNGTLSIDQLSSNLQNTNEQKSIYLKGWQEKKTVNTFFPDAFGHKVIKNTKRRVVDLTLG